MRWDRPQRRLPRPPCAADSVSDETFMVQQVEVEEPDLEPLPEDRFLDRELSWLAFNERVLELAEDDETPLLERARYLAIFASNLDEFFMVRVAGLKRRIAAGFAVPSATGMSPTRLVEALTERAHVLMDRHADVLRRSGPRSSKRASRSSATRSSRMPNRNGCESCSARTSSPC